MITKVQETYTCEYCKKRLVVKSAMEKHEKYCSQNPENFNKCSSCRFLGRSEIDKSFRCTKLNKGIYFIGAVKRNMQSVMDKGELAPKECSEYAWSPSNVLMIYGNYTPQ